MAAAIRIEDTDGVRVVRWERDDALNAMSLEMWDGTRDALDSAIDDGIRCVVLTGSGRAFNVGQDLGEMADPRQADETRGYRGVMRALQDVPVPMIAAVNGLAVGFGVTVLPWCDFVFVSDTARFRLPFVSLGVTTEAASSVTLPEVMGPQAAAHFVLTGDWLSAEDAVATGLALADVPGRRPSSVRPWRWQPGSRTRRPSRCAPPPACSGWNGGPAGPRRWTGRTQHSHDSPGARRISPPSNASSRERETVDALRRELDHLPVQAIARTGDRGVHDRAHRAADPRDPFR